MFPRDFFIDYWKPAIRDEVFVAMPFAKRFDAVWDGAIQPAARDCGLSATRVDTRVTSDSILVDILDGIAHARLVLVDVSAVSCPPCLGLGDLLKRNHRKPRYPNGNVMYELGLAHAMRQAEEVVVIRDDHEHQLLFDVSGVRIHRYPAGDTASSRKTIGALIRDALKVVDQTKALQVSRAIQAMSLRDVKLIRSWWPYPFNVFSKKPEDDLSGVTSDLTEAVSDLQRMGMLRVYAFPAEEKCAVTLVWTEFGNAVVRAMPATVLAGRRDPKTVEETAAARPDEETPVKEPVAPAEP